MNWLILLAVVLIAIRCGLQIHMRIIQHKIWQIKQRGPQ